MHTALSMNQREKHCDEGGLLRCSNMFHVVFFKYSYAEFETESIRILASNTELPVL